MDEKSLKTSWWQRVIIIVVAVLLLGSTMLAYMFIVMNGNKEGAKNSTDAKVEELTAQYDAKNAELEEASKPLSDKYLASFKSYKSNIKSYNAANANADGLKTTDLKVGDGKTLAENDKDYYAYYIGWCADGSVFDSSFDDYENPTKLKTPVDPNMGLIEGWNQGVVGMKIGGVRQISINGDLAYGENKEICGGKNSPLKFIIQVIDKDEKIDAINKELDDLYMQIYSAYYSNTTN